MAGCTLFILGNRFYSGKYPGNCFPGTPESIRAFSPAFLNQYRDLSVTCLPAGNDSDEAACQPAQLYHRHFHPAYVDEFHVEDTCVETYFTK